MDIRRPIDLLKVGKFMLDGGKYEGEQLLSEKYVKDATSNLVSTAKYGINNFEEYGYGYLIWRTRHNSFFFNGMGCQLAVMCPEKNMILIYNGDNQGNTNAKTVIVDGFFEMIYDRVSDSPYEEYAGEPIPEYELYYLKGNYSSPLTSRINGKKFVLANNSMNIKELTLRFGKESGSMTYTNATGEKTMNFGIGKNIFEKFPEDGYSDLVGSVAAPGNKYDCASSAIFPAENELLIRTQIIDKYFGNLAIMMSFKDDTVVLEMCKTAEDFLREYSGIAVGKIEK